MDANGLRFWMLSRHDDWIGADGSNTLYYCAKTNRLQLRSVSRAKPPAEEFTTAQELVEASPITLDHFGNYARWDSTSGHVVAGGSGAGEVPIYAPPPTETVNDLVMGYDGILYVAVAGSLVLVDRRGRWPDCTLSDPDFTFWRLLALPQGGVLALDRRKPQLGKVVGQPLPVGPQDAPDVGILRSCNPANLPRVSVRYPLPGSDVFVAFTAMDQDKFALLSWGAATADNTRASLRLFSEASGLAAPMQVSTLKWPYAIAWAGEQKLAVLASTKNEVPIFKEALIFDLQDATSILLQSGDTYILKDQNVGPFVHGFGLPPSYADGTDILPLLPLSLNSFAQSGATDGIGPTTETTAAVGDPGTPRSLDSGVSQTVWHRMFIEAIIPPRCGVVVWLAASDQRADLNHGGRASWYPHVLGDIDPSGLAQPLPIDAPRAVWQSEPSEVPFAPAMLGQDPVAGRQGLFMVLVQRAGTAVRSLRGRYLGIRLLLSGDQRSTPEIAALRVYASRFSYVEHYLPEIYHEQKFGADADKPGSSTHRDFFERFVNIFEAQLTRIEDHVANSYLLTRPESTPDTALDWLGSWIGLDPAGYPPNRRRVRLLAAPELYRGQKNAPGGRGTVPGITQSLDVATNGLCSRGAIILIEAFRLRRIYATILGADLSIQDDSLLPGFSGSGNSIVGDTLFLGDPLDKDFLALFASAIETPAEQQQVQSFYDQLAHRITVFVHDQVETVDLKLVQTIVEQEKPAHVMATVIRARQPLMVGLASLLGVNTYLAPEPARSAATLNVSQIGRYDVITHTPSLDPRLENGPAAGEWDKPVARINAPAAVSVGQPIPLDGSASKAASGTTLNAFSWKLSNP